VKLAIALWPRRGPRLGGPPPGVWLPCWAGSRGAHRRWRSSRRDCCWQSGRTCGRRATAGGDSCSRRWAWRWWGCAVLYLPLRRGRMRVVYANPQPDALDRVHRARGDRSYAAGQRSRVATTSRRGPDSDRGDDAAGAVDRRHRVGRGHAWRAAAPAARAIGLSAAAAAVRDAVPTAVLPNILMPVVAALVLCTAWLAMAAARRPALAPPWPRAARLVDALAATHTDYIPSGHRATGLTPLSGCGASARGQTGSDAAWGPRTRRVYARW